MINVSIAQTYAKKYNLSIRLSFSFCMRIISQLDASAGTIPGWVIFNNTYLVKKMENENPIDLDSLLLELLYHDSDIFPAQVLEHVLIESQIYGIAGAW